jgi:hypothetical protein
LERPKVLLQAVQMGVVELVEFTLQAVQLLGHDEHVVAFPPAENCPGRHC